MCSLLGAHSVGCDLEMVVVVEMILMTFFFPGSLFSFGNARRGGGRMGLETGSLLAGWDGLHNRKDGIFFHVH